MPEIGIASKHNKSEMLNQISVSNIIYWLITY